MILMLCCNNPDNGCFTGVLDCLQINDAIKLVADKHVSLDFIAPEPGNPAQVKISRRKFPLRAHRKWYGNWCWDAVNVSPETAAEIIAYIREWFHPEEAEESLWNLWMDGKQPITADDLRKVLA